MKRAKPRGGRFFNSDAAATASEYAIVLTLIILTALGAIRLLGSKAEWMMGSLGSELGGVVGLNDGGRSTRTISSGLQHTDRFETDESEESGFTLWNNPFARNDDESAK